MLLKLSEDMKGEMILVVFDAARTTFRNDIYKEYKANRSDPPEELIPQFSLIRDATKALGLKYLEVENYEADDIIATYVKIAKKDNIETVIISSDKDLMQLVQDGVSLLDPMKNTTIGPEGVLEKFGVTPDIMTMANGLEARMPFMDLSLENLVHYGLPLKFKYGIFKKTKPLRGPAEGCDRKKNKK